MEIVDLRRIKQPDDFGKVGSRLLLPVLGPLSLAYSAGVWLWRRFPVKEVDLGLPVVSVGSIAVGGTGKTPVCMYVADRLASRGRRVCIISRGYRRRSGVSPHIVSDGKGVISSVEEAGDEPFMMACRLPGVGVVVGRDRVAAAREAVRHFTPDILVLDDGFQYRRLARRMDIVCLDWRTLRNGHRVLPLGVLREGWSSIRPEHLVVFMLRPGEGRPQSGDLDLVRTSKVVYARRSEPELVKADGAESEGDDIQGEKVLLVSSVARPDAFEATCIDVGIRAAATIRFDDHHWYSGTDAKHLRDRMAEYGCRRIVTTEKDLHKLPPDLRHVTLVLRTGLDLEGAEHLWQMLEASLEV